MKKGNFKDIVKIQFSSNDSNNLTHIIYKCKIFLNSVANSQHREANRNFS